MAFDLEEQEKIDQLKAWWSRFGGLVSSALTVVLLAIAAYFAWGMYKNAQAEKALAYYDTIHTTIKQPMLNAHDKERVLSALSALQTDHQGSAYAGRASLLAAQYFYTQNEADLAQEALLWVIEKSQETELVPFAQLQLSALWMTQEKWDQALSLLQNPTPAFKALFLDRQGDIFLAQMQKDKAKQAWQEALQETNLEPAFANLLDMKLKVLAGE